MYMGRELVAGPALSQIAIGAKGVATVGRNSGGDCLELSFQRRSWVEGKAALPLSHHMNHLYAAQGGGFGGDRLWCMNNF